TAEPWMAPRRKPGTQPDEGARRAADRLRREPWVAKAFTAADLAALPEGSLFHNSWVPGRSPDVMFIPRPGWTVPDEGEALEHRAHWNEAALVPLVIQSPGFELRPALRGATLRA